MLGLAMKLYGILMPFLKEILLGNKRIKKQERNINYFLMFACAVMFGMLFISNVTNSKLISKIKEQEAAIAAAKEESKTLSNAANVAKEEYTKNLITLSECISKNDFLNDRVDELENIDCSDNPNSLANRFRNLENGVCELDKIDLKAGMPPLPKISRTVDNNRAGDSYTGEVLIKYVGELREYIRVQDALLEKQKSNCK